MDYPRPASLNDERPVDIEEKERIIMFKAPPHQPSHQMLYDLAVEFCPDEYLEIGCFMGDSLKAVLAGCRPQKVILCDIWAAGYAGSGMGNHNHLLPIVADIPEVIWLDGDSKLLIPTLPNASVGLSYVDGDHTDEGARADLENTWLKLKIGGFLVFDDIIHPQCMSLKKVALEFGQSVGAEIYRWDDTTGLGACVFRKNR